MNNIILKNGIFLLEDDFELVPYYGHLIIKEGKIHSYSNSFNIDKDDYEIIELNNKIVTKPLINFHEHSYSKLAKGFKIKSNLESFDKILSDYWWKEDLCLDEESIYYSALLTGIDSIKNGIGIIFDHHSSPNFVEGSLEILSKAYETLYIKNVLCYEISDRNNKVICNKSIDENFDFIQKNKQNSKGMIGLHASFTLEDDTLKKIAEYNKNINAGIHVHICEGTEDTELSLLKYGKRPLNRFIDFGLCNSKSIFAHGVNLNNEELKYLENQNIALAINIDSNLNNAVGVHNYKQVINNLVLTGTDGMHQNIFKSFKNLFLVSRLNGLSFEQSFNFIKNIYFKSNIFANKYFKLNKLQVNDDADLVIWDYIPPTPADKENIWSHIIYGLTESKVQHFIHNGMFLLKNYNLTIIDEADVNINAKKSALDLFSKFSKLG